MTTKTRTYQPGSSTMPTIDRVELARAVAKTIAYSNIGKLADAKTWANEIRRLLEEAGL